MSHICSRDQRNRAYLLKLRSARVIFSTTCEYCTVSCCREVLYNLPLDCLSGNGVQKNEVRSKQCIYRVQRKRQKVRPLGEGHCMHNPLVLQYLTKWHKCTHDTPRNFQRPHTLIHHGRSKGNQPSLQHSDVPLSDYHFSTARQLPLLETTFLHHFRDDRPVRVASLPRDFPGCLAGLRKNDRHLVGRTSTRGETPGLPLRRFHCHLSSGPGARIRRWSRKR